jgi:hypothetical protein
MLLEVESCERVAPSAVQGPGRFPPKFEINKERIWKEEAELEYLNPGVVINFLTALFLSSGSSDLSGIKDSGGCF